jgi:hypothetical protein
MDNGMGRLLPLAVSFGLLAACSPPPPATTTKPAEKDKVAKRPPQPVMASASWGEHVALELGVKVAPVTIPADTLLKDAITALHALDVSSEARARDLALQAWKSGSTDEQRGLALAIVAASMVYDPLVDGYTERLTDAYGLALYAGTVESGNIDGHSLRAIVLAAAGANRQARELIDVVKKTPKLPDSARPLLALAWAAVNERSDVFFTAAKDGLAARADSDRLRVALADRLLDLGFNDDALAAVTVEHPVPALRLAAARARVLKGDATAVTALQELSTSLTGVDESRRAEALYWLAEAQLLNDEDGAAAETAAQVEARPGWQREGQLVRAELALRASNVIDAKGMLMPLAQGTPTSTVPTERRIARLLLDGAAAARDAGAVDRAIRRLSGLDVDPEAIDAARKLVESGGKAAPDGKAIWRTVVAPTAAQAQLLRARRALNMDATALARRELDVLLKDPLQRAARAVDATFPRDDLAAQAAAGVAALEGKGPALVEADLVGVVDALGAAPTPGGAARLAAFAKDSRERVAKTAERSIVELENPAQRRKRVAGEHDDHPTPGMPLPPKAEQ